MSFHLDAAFLVTFGQASQSVIDNFLKLNLEHPERELHSLAEEGEYIIRQDGATVKDVRAIAETIFTDDIDLANEAMIAFHPRIDISASANLFELAAIEPTRFHVWRDQLTDNEG